MPLYEYHCLQCKKHMEIMQKISDPLLKKCPKCGGKIEKLLSASAFHLKGSGWYKTDYATKPAQKDLNEPKKEEKKEIKKGEGSPEATKPATNKFSQKDNR